MLLFSALVEYAETKQTEAAVSLLLLLLLLLGGGGGGGVLP